MENMLWWVILLGDMGGFVEGVRGLFIVGVFCGVW
jgi:hypothetical protein